VRRTLSLIPGGLPGRSVPLACLLLLAVGVSAARPLPDSGAASPARTGGIAGTVASDISTAFHDAVGFFTAPLSFGKPDLERTATGAGAFGIMMAMDEPLNRLLITHPDRGFLEDPLEWAKEWGRLRSMQYASLGTYVGGLIAGNDGLRVTGRLMGEALLLAGAPAITLQYGLGRSRPHAGEGAFRYRFLQWRNENQSLPSGHATVAFAISTVLAKRIDRAWVSAPLYAFAGLTALSLAWGNEHWPSDVILGSALGYLAGSYVVSEEERREGEDGGSRSQQNRSRLGFGIGRGGVSFTYIIY